MKYNITFYIDELDIIYGFKIKNDARYDLAGRKFKLTKGYKAYRMQLSDKLLMNFYLITLPANERGRKWHLEITLFDIMIRWKPVSKDVVPFVLLSTIKKYNQITK